MSDTQQLPLSVQPVISYPREAQMGKTYLMTIDLQPLARSGSMRRRSIPFIVCWTLRLCLVTSL
jgi:hypothetical protein